ncbi:MAG: hypothetical protein AAB270_08240 [Chloroflexota bacterium]
MPPQQDPSLSDPTVWEQQLQIYAQELHDLYLEEKKYRQELAEDKLVLEYKLRELGALNKLFQQHLEHRQRVESAHQDLVAALRALLPKVGEVSLRQELERLLTQAEAAIIGPAREAPKEKP